MPKGIKVIKPTPEKLEALGVKQWSPWSCDVSEFDWQYDGTETCLIHEGKVEVVTSEGSVVVGSGDLVQFDDGLKCRWVVTEPIRKVYSFDVDEL